MVVKGCACEGTRAGSPLAAEVRGACIAIWLSLLRRLCPKSMPARQDRRRSAQPATTCCWCRRRPNSPATGVEIVPVEELHARRPEQAEGGEEQALAKAHRRSRDEILARRGRFAAASHYKPGRGSAHANLCPVATSSTCRRTTRRLASGRTPAGEPNGGAATTSAPPRDLERRDARRLDRDFDQRHGGPDVAIEKMKRGAQVDQARRATSFTIPGQFGRSPARRAPGRSPRRSALIAALWIFIFVPPTPMAP